MSLREVPAKLRARARVGSAFRAVFAGPDGALVLRELMRECGLMEVSHTPDAPTHTAYREGRRSIGLEILRRLRWSEAELLQLSQETADERLKALEDA